MADVIAELRALIDRANATRLWQARLLRTLIHIVPAGKPIAEVSTRICLASERAELIAAAVNALPALLDVAETARAALPVLERMDTLRHIAPEFDELDNLRAALARLEGRA